MRDFLAASIPVPDIEPDRSSKKIKSIFLAFSFVEISGGKNVSAIQF